MNAFSAQIKGAGVNRAAKVDNVEVNLDEEEPQKASKVEEKKNGEPEKEQNAIEEDKNRGERISINIDEDVSERNNDFVVEDNEVKKDLDLPKK